MEISKNSEYRAGQYQVMVETVTGRYFISKIFDNEAEARIHGNEVWKSPDTKMVQILRTGFYKKRRRSRVIASATKHQEREATTWQA